MVRIILKTMQQACATTQPYSVILTKVCVVKWVLQSYILSPSPWMLTTLFNQLTTIYSNVICVYQNCSNRVSTIKCKRGAT